MLFHVVDVGTHTTMHSCMNIHTFFSFPREWNNSSPGWCCGWKEEWIKHPAPQITCPEQEVSPVGPHWDRPGCFWIPGLWLGIWEPVFLPGCSLGGEGCTCVRLHAQLCSGHLTSQEQGRGTCEDTLPAVAHTQAPFHGHLPLSTSSMVISHLTAWKPRASAQGSLFQSSTCLAIHICNEQVSPGPSGHCW